MRITSRLATDALRAYGLQKSAFSSSQSKSEHDRLQRQIKRTRETLLNDGPEDTFAAILKQAAESTRN